MVPNSIHARSSIMSFMDRWRGRRQDDDEYESASPDDEPKEEIARRSSPRTSSQFPA